MAEAAVATTLQAEREKRETTEFITILKTMSESEKQQIKGIMIGIQLSKANPTTGLQRA